MKYCILITGSPFSSNAPLSALKFAEAALQAGHELYRIFLYQDAVLLATTLACPPQNEFDIFLAWQRFTAQHKLDVVTCIGAGARRGIINAQEASRQEKPASNLPHEFDLSGLGQFIDASAMCDRVMVFGA